MRRGGRCGGCSRGAWRAGRSKQGTVARWVGGLWGSRAPAREHAQGCSWVGRLTDVRPGSPEGAPRTVVRSGLGGLGPHGEAAPRGRSLPVVRDVGWIQRGCTEGTRHWVELWEGVRGALSAHERYLNTGTQAEKREASRKGETSEWAGPKPSKGKSKKGTPSSKKAEPPKKGAGSNKTETRSWRAGGSSTHIHGEPRVLRIARRHSEGLPNAR